MDPRNALLHAQSPVALYTKLMDDERLRSTVDNRPVLAMTANVLAVTKRF